MSFVKKTLVFTLMLMAPWLGHAAGFSYNYGQVEYHSGDFDGLGFSGSFVINHELFIRAGYINATDDGVGVEVDYTRFNVGLGLHMPLNPQTDGVLTVSFVSEEAETESAVFSTSVDDTGLMVTGGVRHQLNPKIELAGELFYIDALDDDLGLYAEARYLFNPGMTGGLGFTSSDTLDGLSINFRVDF